MKEQNKTPEKELTKMEICNLSDAEFKTLVIRMLKELTGYFNSRKKTQEEMKLTLSEIKKNLQGTNSGVDKAKNQIKSLIYLFQTEGKGGREGEKHQCVVTAHTPPTGGPALACNPSLCPDWEWDQRPIGSALNQASTQSTEPHQPGLEFSF